MVLQAKVAVSIVEDIILLHIILSSSEGCSLDEFSCSWSEFYEFCNALPTSLSTDCKVDIDDHTNPEKLQNFIELLMNSQESPGILFSFQSLRLRQSEKINFLRFSEMSDKVARLESDNVALQRVVMDLIGTVDSLKSRLLTLEKSNSIREQVALSSHTDDNNSISGEGDVKYISPIVSESDPNLKMYLRFEREMDEFIRMLQPREAQISFRQDAASTMKAFILKAVKCNAFVISFSELKCFLPDDPIKLTVVLNHALTSTWYKVLFDRLVILSEQQEIRSESSLMHLDQQDISFKIRDIRLISEADTFKISGFIDNMPFEIVENGRVDLSMLAFFEEVGALVGNDHLLKRSVLLIRAWWWYESLVEGEKSPRDYLPDCALWLMTSALFNLYHRLIVDPVQALYLFLHIYGSFDGRNDIITLYGLKRIPESAYHCAIDRDDREYLIPPKLFEKYYNVVNISHEANPTTTPPIQQWKVDNSSFVILNPFTMENITLEKLSSRKVEKIQAILKQGLTNLKSIFDDTSGQLTSLTATVFPQTMRSLLAGVARRDTAASTRQGAMSIDYIEMMKSPRDVYYVEVSQLWHEILLCNFILQGLVSESALLSLCVQVLVDRRILPVGEVGKIVSDIVASPFLSSQLKEKFGGLKKFLEKYPEIFVFSKDHPFNPHVVLKRYCNAEQLEMVDAGMSLHAIFKTSQRSQQQQQQQSSGSASSNGANHQRHSGNLGPPEAVQVGKKALESRNPNHGQANFSQGGNGSGRYDFGNSSAAGGYRQYHPSMSRSGDLVEPPFPPNHHGASHHNSSFNLDLSWRHGSESRPYSASSWTGSQSSSSTASFPASMKGSSGEFHSAVAGVPRLRGVDENFSSRYRGQYDHNDLYYSRAGGSNRFSGYPDPQDSLGPASTPYGIFPTASSNSSNYPTSNNNSGSFPSSSFEHSQQRSFGGAASSLLNSPSISRGQQSSQSQGDAFFSYSHTSNMK